MVIMIYCTLSTVLLCCGMCATKFVHAQPTIAWSPEPHHLISSTQSKPNQPTQSEFLRLPAAKQKHSSRSPPPRVSAHTNASRS